MTTLPVDIARLTLWFVGLAARPWAPRLDPPPELAEAEQRYAAEMGFERAADGRWVTKPPTAS
jgi:hypothetical protein